MPKQKPIQINIPNPCSQPWEEMTPSGQGRFCGHCQKTVIDFTAWSDDAMYRFFSENTGKVCGRFLATQVGRSIDIPPQPHSRLYRMMMALGLTLLFTQATDVLAQNRPPLTAQSGAQKQKSKPDTAGVAKGEISGQVLDENKEPILYAAVWAYQDGILKGGNVTDFDGVYSVKPLEPGSYNLLITSFGYDSISINRVVVKTGKQTTQNLKMARDSRLVLTGLYETVEIPKKRHKKHHRR